MRTARLRHLTTLALCCTAVCAVSARSGATRGEERKEESPQRRERPGAGAAGVYKAKIEPHWFENNTRFWYRNDLKGGNKEFVLVDAVQGKRGPAFDHAKLTAGLAKAAGREFRAERLPLATIEYVEENKAILFEAANQRWKCDLATYECAPVEKPAEKPAENGEPPKPEKQSSAEGESLPSPQQPQGPRRPGFGRPEFGEPGRPVRSPDRKHTALIKDQNVYLRSEEDGLEIALTTDGKEGNAYGRLEWSPDSTALVAWRIEPGDRKEVHLLQSSPPGGGRAVLQSRPYPLPGDKFTAYELAVFDVAERKMTKPAIERVDYGSPRLRWNKDGVRFSYQKTDRGHQRFRLIEVNARTGETRNIIDEQTETFIWTAHTESVNIPAITWLAGGGELLYVSERDGWRHAYLVDAETGTIKNQVTRGEWVLRGIDRLDEEQRELWFRASGVFPGQDPYLVHFGRVKLDGGEPVWLTSGDGNHSISYSPDRKYLIDTYTRIDFPAASELRRASDGKLVCELERADISELRERGWEAPEVFVAKGRDGKTDIWGILCRPKNLDPGKKYAVIEDIYAGPQGSFVPKSFSTQRRYESLTSLGFIVAKIDGMGTANRSKAFHDVCWKNLKDAGFEDRILWHKAVAAKYPYYDVSRVGIYGGSAGGQNAAGAVLFHGEFYKAAVANCGCHDNRLDKASWNEQWMGYPVGKHYSASSNIDNAHRLTGKLMLVVGEMDTNVPPESTYRFVDALVRAGKDFDFLLIPNGGHGAGGEYGQRRLRDFFVRHLQGVEPPDRNAPRR
jgi:dipeptidyl aminopeptidase/acylaminoacyl peptidase